MSASLSVSGRLTRRDLKQLVNMSRTGTVGPTALYYAGLTAPVISAGVALLARDAARTLHWAPFWQAFAAAQLAAITGIAWYLIFMRWSYRHSSGRGMERTEDTEIIAAEEGLRVRRGLVETRIAWAAVREVRAAKAGVAVFCDGAETLLVPDNWFGGDAARKDAFARALRQKGAS
jgi:Bacterial PH domain